jgi:tight adherence protein B
LTTRGLPTVYAALAAFISLITIPTFILKVKADRYIKRFTTHFPKALQVIRGCLSAGLGLPVSFERASTDCPYPVSREFKIMEEKQSLGKSFVECLSDMSARIPTSDVKTFTVAITVQQEAGGNLVELMRNLEETITARITLRKELSVLTAQARFSGLVLGLLPPALAVAIKTVNPDYFALFFEHPMGRPLVAYIIILEILGFIVIQWLINIRIKT